VQAILSETREFDPGEDEAEDDAAFWLSTAGVRHIGPVRIERLLNAFGSLRQAWSAPRAELASVLEPRPLSELINARSGIDPARELEKLRARGIQIVYPGHRAYPTLLAEISGRPSILFVRGRLTADDDNAVAIVGTRRTTSYGRQAAEQVASELAQAGVTVVSGLARGIDTAAHRAALAAGGRTIAVLGSGVDVIYPGENCNLADQIIESGAIVSEFVPGTKPDAQNFPARNRIVSGMSLGTVIIEAPSRSGALITASFAADQGREVFVVPGNVYSPASEGTNALLRDGARLIRNGADVLEDLGLLTSGRSAPTQMPLLVDERESRVFSVVGSEASHIDDIAEQANLAAAETGAILLTLELRGLLRNLGAQYYVKR
jgi:DNA processing protein